MSANGKFIVREYSDPCCHVRISVDVQDDTLTTKNYVGFDLSYDDTLMGQWIGRTKLGAIINSPLGSSSNSVYLLKDLKTNKVGLYIKEHLLFYGDQLTLLEDNFWEDDYLSNCLSYRKWWILLNNKYIYCKSGAKTYFSNLNNNNEIATNLTYLVNNQRKVGSEKELNRIMMTQRIENQLVSETISKYELAIDSADIIVFDDAPMVDIEELYNKLEEIFKMDGVDKYFIKTEQRYLNKDECIEVPHPNSIHSSYTTSYELVMTDARVCSNCGKLILCGDAIYDEYDFSNRRLCYDCYNMTKKYKIRGYYDNPKLEYYGYDAEKGENYQMRVNPSEFAGYGIELEVGNGGEKDSESELAIKILHDEAYAKHDSSIFDSSEYEDEDREDEEYDDDWDDEREEARMRQLRAKHGGFEIITHPHTKEALYNMKWEKLFRHLLKHGYRSHDICTCGLHLHISRTLFTGIDAIAKMMYFYEKNFDDVARFARRTHMLANRWASKYLGSERTITKDNILQVFERYDKRGFHDSRYRCVNIQNANTVEVRIVRGTLKKETFWASLDFLIKIAENANKIKWEDIDNLDLWLDGLNPDTIEYMKTRGCFGYTKEYVEPRNPESEELNKILKEEEEE